MNEGTFLLALHESPDDEVTWLTLADWLEEDGQPQRAELVRLARRLRAVRELARTRKRAALENRLAALLRAGVRPAVPEVVNAIGMRLALIPPGTFLMGSPEAETDRSGPREGAHEVEITRPFYLGVFEVTQAQYREVTGRSPSDFSAAGSNRQSVKGLDTSEFPVEMVSWRDAVKFCRLLGKHPEEKRAGRAYRLPTEAEWEYACRAGTTGTFHTGDSLSSTQANFNGNHPSGGAPRGPYLKRTCAVGSYAPNLFGLYDMHGNVYEWCSDWYHVGYYDRSPRQDPAGPTRGSVRVLRGGSWFNYGHVCRAAYRSHDAPDSRTIYFGFRVACAVP